MRITHCLPRVSMLPIKIKQENYDHLVALVFLSISFINSRDVHLLPNNKKNVIILKRK